MATITEIIPERCETCGVEKEGMQQCSKCKVVRYCSRECQKIDWSTHKQACKKQEKSSKATVRERCESCGVEKSGMKKCSKCKSVQYCSTACQKRDWGKHKQACKKQEASEVATVRESCESCGVEKSGMKKCSQCKSVQYCSTVCQRRDWEKHKQACKAAANIKTCIVCKKRDALVKPCSDCKCDTVTYCSEACKMRDAPDHRWKCMLVQQLVKRDQFAEKVKALIGGDDVCTIDEILPHYMFVEGRPIVVVAKIIKPLIVRKIPPGLLRFMMPPVILHGMVIEDCEGKRIDVILNFTQSFPHFHFDDIKEGNYVLLFNPPMKMPDNPMLMLMGEEPDIEMDEAKDVKIVEL